jgi:hypothetical protein
VCVPSLGRSLRAFRLRQGDPVRRQAFRPLVTVVALVLHQGGPSRLLMVAADQPAVTPLAVNVDDHMAGQRETGHQLCAGLELSHGRRLGANASRRLLKACSLTEFSDSGLESKRLYSAVHLEGASTWYARDPAFAQCVCAECGADRAGEMRAAFGHVQA